MEEKEYTDFLNWCDHVKDPVNVPKKYQKFVDELRVAIAKVVNRPTRRKVRTPVSYNNLALSPSSTSG